MFMQLLYFCLKSLTDDKDYVKRLLNEAATIHVDKTPDYDIHLPPFYNEEQFKRLYYLKIRFVH